VKSDLEKLYSHIADIEVAMMTTRRNDGHLQSRAMATQKRALGADLWFVTLEGAQKLLDLDNDPHVNLAYYKDRTREWVSVSGIASVTRDRAKIHELWAPDWKAWFPKEGDDRRSADRGL
jgi:general stress protein 26